MIVIPVLLYSQDDVYRYNAQEVRAVSPTAAAFGKYVETPVSYYSGVPNIGIPIYELDVNGFKLPISLSYHSGGIKVQELESWVGLGWNLNVGGVITRVVKGKSDEYTKYSCNSYNKEILHALEVDSSIGLNSLTPSIRNSLLYGMLNDYPDQPLDYSRGFLDCTFDEFVFNFMGNTGRFMYDKYAERFVCSNDKLKIESIDAPYPFSEDGINAFKIIDDQGNQYCFQSIEPAVDMACYNSNNTSCYFAQSYYLTKIALYKSKKDITFLYDRVKINECEFGGGKETYLMKAFYKILYPPNTAEFHYGDVSNCNLYRITADIDELEYEEAGWRNNDAAKYLGRLFLREIRVDNTSIKFYSHKDTNFKEYREVIKLDSIIVHAGLDEVKRTIFNYDYFTTNNNDKKVKLKNINIDEKTYAFDYFEEYDGKRIPDYRSLGMDYWGYYNGHDENKFLTINIKPELIPNVIISRREKINSIRTPDINYTRLGCLKKIIFPTKGYTIFEYESNTYSHLYYNGFSYANDPLDFLINETEVEGKYRIGGGLRIASIKKYNYKNNLEVNKKYEYHDSNNISFGVLETPYSNCKGRVIYEYESVKKSEWGFDYVAFGDPTVSFHRWLLYLDIFANSFIPLSGNTTASVGYKKVVEKDIINNGYIEYNYTTGEDYPDEYATEPYRKYYIANVSVPYTIETSKLLTLYKIKDNSGMRGLMKSRIVCDANNFLIHKSENRYMKRLGKDGSMRFANVKWEYDHFTANMVFDKFTPCYPLLDFKRNTDYFANDSIVVETNYIYNSEYPFVEKETSLKNGKTYKKEYVYVDENTEGNAYIDELKNINRIVFPLKTTSYIDDKEIYTRENLVNKENGVILPQTIKEVFNGQQLPETSMKYDSYGNVKKISLNDGSYKYYIWAYNGQYPVVEIVSGQNFDLSVTIDDGQLKNTDIESDVKSDINYLKTQLATILSDKSNHVSIFTFKPLVGVTSETDVNGNSLFYKYDIYGRLITIKDGEGNIVKSYQYNFAGK